MATKRIGFSKRNTALAVFVLVLALPDCRGALLHESCTKNADCFAEHSQCDETYNACVCRPYTVEYNETTCLQGTLLGFECKTDAQCAIKVPTSGCINGICSCEDGYVAYRRHTCLVPSKLGEICFDNQQCALADKLSTCKFVVPRVFGRCQCASGKEMDGYTKRCLSKNTKIGQACDDDAECSTSHAFCQRKLDGSSVCTCEVAYAPSADRARCLPTYRGVFSATSLGYACHSNIQCQLADPNSICNSASGICDCAASNSTCNARSRGCHRSTFQCQSDGKCISWYFMCDGKQHCEDGSDEVCEVREKCPDQAFQCDAPDLQSTTTPRSLPSRNITLISDSTILSSLAAEFEAMRARKMPIKCISRAKLCDGIFDCDNGSDEEGCTGKETCPHGTFQCLKTKDCLPEHKFCNAIADCPGDQSDESELECRMEFQPSEYCPYRCADGRCRSSAIVCSGIEGCLEGEDEKSCQVCRCPRVS